MMFADPILAGQMMCDAVWPGGHVYRRLKDGLLRLKYLKTELLGACGFADILSDLDRGPGPGTRPDPGDPILCAGRR
jgi:hypothetical protein